MILTIWRHGQAGTAVSDRERELTGTGTDDIAFGSQQFSQACKARELALPDSVLYSPWLRTSETANIILSTFEHSASQVLPALQPGSSVAAVESALQDFFTGASSCEHLLLVSHQPLVSELVGHYLGEIGVVPSLPPGGLVSLETGVNGAACARLLFWALPPEYEVGI